MAENLRQVTEDYMKNKDKDEIIPDEMLEIFALADHI
jgi:hypothetical protein